MILKLTPHLSLAEVIKSETAQRFSIDNNPPEEHLNNLKRMATELFEPLRAAISKERGVDTPLVVTSGYRCAALNKKIGGSARSQHCVGQALDLNINGWFEDFDNGDLFYLILEEFSFDQLIWEFGDEEAPDWVHVSYVTKGDNRKKVTLAKRIDGKTVYKNLED